MKKLKIALVTPYPPSKGTLNEYAFHLVKHMKENESYEEIIIITDKLPKEDSYTIEESPIKLTFKEVWRFNSLSNFYNIIKTIRSCKPDIVLFNIQFLSFGDKKIPATLGLLTPMLSKLIGFKTVVLLHNIIETVDYASAGITNNPVMRWFYNSVGTVLTKMVLQADLVALTMDKYVNIIKEKYGAQNVALLPHGSFETPKLPDFNKGSDKKQVMTFGKFGTYKKVEKMIEAVELIRERTKEEIEIVIAGTDNPNVKGYLKNVENQYAGVKNIRFTGYVEEADVPKLFTDSTAVVFPYTSTTGSSGVLHQAGSYGKAVALPNIGDLKELIEKEGYVGSFFKSDDVNDMSDSIEKLLFDKDYRLRIAEQNYKAASSLPMSKVVDMYTRHFYELLKQNTYSGYTEISIA